MLGRSVDHGYGFAEAGWGQTKLWADSEGSVPTAGGLPLSALWEVPSEGPVLPVSSV